MPTVWSPGNWIECIGCGEFEFFGSVFHMVRRAARAIPVSDPRFSLAVLGGALTAGKRAHGMVDHYWGRGPLMMAWAAVGMSLRMYFKTRTPQAFEQHPEASDEFEEYATLHVGAGDHEIARD